ncbi:MAG: HAMP domain-containing histidine kinase [Myxococcales bacterium]|nr:HAMP domain-containing histidine kinase [Myxococcales bacterium]
MARPAPNLGLRSQLLLSLGLLAVVAFVPLYFALAGLTRVTLERTRDDAAKALGRAVAGRLGDHVGGADPALRDVAMASLDASAREGVVAIRVTRPARPALEVGNEAALGALRTHAPQAGEHTLRGDAPGLGPYVATEVASERGVVQVALRIGDEASRAAPLLRLLAFYTTGFAVILLTLAYTLLTRLIVRPVGALAVATARIAERRPRGDADSDDPHPSLRLLDPARGGAKEVVELGRAIAATTGLLVERERSLAAKVRQLEAARADLLAARDAIVRSERLASVGRLAAGLAHEVGNPLAALLGLEEVLLLSGLDEESHDLVQRMKRETERMHVVMRDLLEFARSGQDPAAPAPDASCAVAEVAAEVVALLTPQKALRDVEVALDVEPALPPVRLPGARLQQVLLNLVLNAADAIGEGGGSRIGLRAERAGKHRVRILVEDDGPGIPERIRETLFEPFVTTKEVGKGTGLGLAVCRGIVDGAHGTLVVAAPKGRGTTFVIELPTVDAPLPPRSIAPPAATGY